MYGNIGVISDKGNIRKNDEDSVLALEGCSIYNSTIINYGLFIIADGMGGHAKGEVASLMAIEKVGSRLLNKLFLKIGTLSDNKDDTNPLIDKKNNIVTDELKKIIKDAILKANEEIIEFSSANRGYEGMGTTLALALVVNNLLFVANIGDSRAYLIDSEKGKIKQITKDDSQLQAELDQGKLTYEDVQYPRSPHAIEIERYILKAVGIDKEIDFDIKEFPFYKNDILLLCCDGLTDEANDEEIKKIVLNHSSAQKAAEKLVELVKKERKGKDNISIIIVDTRTWEGFLSDVNKTIIRKKNREDSSVVKHHDTKEKNNTISFVGIR